MDLALNHSANNDFFRKKIYRDPLKSLKRHTLNCIEFNRDT